jgi:hypothetical protein
MNANKGPVDSLLWTAGASLFFPKKWQTVSNFYWDFAPYAPNAAQSFGGTTTWNLPNNIATYFGKILLKFRVSAATHTYATAAYDDFLGYAAWNYAFVQYGANKVDYLGGEFTKFKFYDEQMTLFKRQAVQRYIQGPLPLADRQLNLVNGCECLVELPFWMTRGYGSMLPCVMGTDLQFGVVWRELAEIIWSAPADAGAFTVAPTIIEQTLYIQQVYTSPNEQGELFTHATNGIMQLMDRQITTESRATLPLVNVQTSTYTVPTNQVNVPNSYQDVILRTVEQISTPYKIDRWRQRGGPNDTGMRIQRCYWTTSAGTIRQPISIGAVKPYQSTWFRDNPGLSDSSIQMDVTMQPLLAATSFGALNTSNLAGYALVMDVLSTGSTEYPLITICSTVKNAMKYQNGNLWNTFQ